MNGKLILFDCDGTLVDSQSFIHSMFLKSIKHVGGGDPPPELIAEMPFLTFKQTWGRLEGNLTPEQIVAASEHMMREITAIRASETPQERLFPGILAVLDTLEAQGYQLGIVTNKGGHSLELVLKGNGIYQRFVTFNHTDNAPPKPSPQMVLNGLRGAGIDAANALVVGDGVFDVLAGKNAGVDVIGVSWNEPASPELHEAKPWAVLEKVDDLLPAITRYWS
jgi:phosphoglycolate phosphatase